MTTDPQGSLFGEGRMTPPRHDPTPDPAVIRRRLDRVLRKLRGANTMPWPEREERMWRTIVPNMAKWLPEDEAAEIRAAFAQELERLRGSR